MIKYFLKLLSLTFDTSKIVKFIITHTDYLYMEYKKLLFFGILNLII